MRILIGVLTAFLLLPIGAAQAQYLTRDLTRVVVSGRPFQLTFAGVLNPNCSPAGRTTIRVVRGPQHGVTRMAQVADWAQYPPGHSRSVCNVRRVNGTAAYYTSRRGFVVADSIVLDVIYPTGGLLRMNFRLDVR